MLVVKIYNRERAYNYASRWAFDRNPLFKNYEMIGGNCTNFVSQCVFAGGCVMNFTPIFGWYYLSDEERSAAWTGVEYFYNFITGNNGEGPFGREVGYDGLEVGDVIQLGREGAGFYHSLLVVGAEGENYLVAAQSDDAFGRSLATYTYDFARFIKIEGVRVDVEGITDCYPGLIDGTSLITDN